MRVPTWCIRKARRALALAPLSGAASGADPGSGQWLDDLDGEAARSPAPGNWVLAPIPFRNELIGAGLLLAAAYLYRAADAPDSARHSFAALGGMYAEQGTWAALGGHRGYWSRERYRTTLGLVTGELLYDIELDENASTRTVALAQALSGGVAEAAVKLGASAWLGLGLTRGTTEIRIRKADPPLPEELPASSITLSSMRVSGEWDTRDSDLYPRSGRHARLHLQFARAALGSDRDFEALELEWNAYHPLGDAQVLAWRIAGKAVAGDVPFFARAWLGAGVDLRGYTPGRYIGDSMLAAQVEWRRQLSTRWGMTAFAGAAKVADALGDIPTDRWLPAAGLGLRMRLSKSLPINLRADLAWGRDDRTFNLAVGEAF